MALDELSLCLAACGELRYETHELRCDLFDSFRKTAWLILCDPQCEWSPQAELIRRKLWCFINNLCQTPRAWKGTLSANLGYDNCDFARLVERNLGEDQSSNASTLVRIWDSMCSQSKDSGPLQIVLADQIRMMRDDVCDFRILANKRDQIFYQSLLEELELNGEHLFCTPNRIKQQPPFSCLVTCGPFRENDFIFTAPRYDAVLNVRWASDDDVIGFPDYITTRERSDEESKFPDDFPVRVTETVHEREFVFKVEPIHVKLSDDWSYHSFEQIYIPRTRRRNRLSKLRGYNHAVDSAETSASDSASESEKARYTNLVFTNGANLVQPFDQQDKPRLMMSIDPEADFEIKKRRPVDSFQESENDEDWLTPGMLAIIEPDASDKLAAAATHDRQTNVFHLPKWKAQLRAKLADIKEAGRSLRFEMQLVGLDKEYRDIESTLRWWSRDKTVRTNAPGNIDAFKKLVCDFIEYENWEAAWEEVNEIWNESISVGLTRESNIDRYLMASVQNQVDDILDSPLTRLEVEGFSTEVLVIEIAEIQFLTEEQVKRSDVDCIIGLDID